MTTRIAVAAAAVLLLTGCASAEPPAPGPESSGRAADAAAACTHLTADDLGDQLEASFSPGRDVSVKEGEVHCRWAAQGRPALVETVVQTGGAAERFARTRQESQRGVGYVTRREVRGADRSFQVDSVGVAAMVVDGRYIQLTVGVPTVTPKRLDRIASQVVRSVSRS